MDDWADHISELYEEYMAQNCTCHRSDDECNCMSFEAFQEDYIQTLREAWEERVWEAHREKLECQV